jgi:4-amino-4-deoxy-L-arabinose transferase-like glycosyltransferase
MERREAIALTAVLAVAAVLRLWGLTQNGTPHAYYAAAVRSMLTRWSNFFFGSFDPGGFVTVDKPPVALWVQTASAKLFGFSGPSLLMPQVVMGVLAVAVIYLTVRRVAGSAAGLIAGLALAIMPVSVAVDRANQPDACLVLVLLLGAWAATRATESGNLRLLLLACALVGIGFNVKMLAAFVVLPTVFALYLLGAPLDRRRRLSHLTIGTLVLAGVSLSWPVAVDLTPADRRPYVGGSPDNSALGLAIGFNGVQRVLGMFGARGPGTRPGLAPRAMRTAEAEGSETPPDVPKDILDRMQGFVRRIPGFGGAPGFFRLARPHMAGQVMWLFPLALIGVFTAAMAERWRLPLNVRQQALFLWSGWFGTWAIVLSFSQGIIHDYYTVMLAPPLAALVGIGAAALWQRIRNSGWKSWLLPAAIAVTALWQLQMLSEYEGWWIRLGPATIGLTGLSLCLLAAIRGRLDRPWVGVAAASAALAALVVCPLAWSLTSVLERGIPAMPMAGPRSLLLRPPEPPPGFPDPGPMRTMRPPVMPGEATVDPALVDFLLYHRRDEKYLVAGPNSHVVAPIIVEIGEPAIALGGFAGADPIVTRDEFSEMVAEGQVRFVIDSRRARPRLGRPGSRTLVDGSTGPAVRDLMRGPGSGLGRLRRRGRPEPEAMEWVRAECRPVDPVLWREVTTEFPTGGDPFALPFLPPGPGGNARPGALYDCRTAVDSRAE